jgi:hypothetical protein
MRSRSDDDGNRAALSDLREYLPERWPCLIGYFNVEVQRRKSGMNGYAVRPK